MKKKSKRSQYIEIRRLIRECDKYFSLYVRREDALIHKNCPLCKRKPIEVCFHFISRKRWATRWRLENAIGACKTCNYWERFFPDPSRMFQIGMWGLETYFELVKSASGLNTKPSVRRLKQIGDLYRRKYAERGHYQGDECRGVRGVPSMGQEAVGPVY